MHACRRRGGKRPRAGVVRIPSGESERASASQPLIRHRRNAFPLLRNPPQQTWWVSAAREVLRKGCDGQAKAQEGGVGKPSPKLVPGRFGELRRKATALTARGWLLP